MCTREANSTESGIRGCAPFIILCVQRLEGSLQRWTNASSRWRGASNFGRTPPAAARIRPALDGSLQPLEGIKKFPPALHERVQPLDGARFVVKTRDNLEQTRFVVKTRDNLEQQRHTINTTTAHATAKYYKDPGGPQRLTETHSRKLEVCSTYSEQHS